MKKLSIFLLIFSMILSSVSPAYSGPKKARTATIQGRITNSVTNQAISRVAVRAGRYRASTNASGNYVIKNVKVWFWGRVYRVRVSAKGYYSRSRWIYVRRGKTRTLNFRLKPRITTATIKGKITDRKTNKPISDVQVQARDWRNRHRYEASTDSSGNYVIKNVYTGFWRNIYRITARKKGYRTQRRWVYVRAGRTYIRNFRLIPIKPPLVVEIISPKNNSYINGSSLDVLVKWQGRSRRIDLYLDDSLAESYRIWRWWYRSGNHTFKVDLSSQEDGEHKLRIIAYRSHRRRGYKAESKEITFILDNTSPLISDISPENNALINNNLPEISSILSDATSEIDKETIVLKIDDSKVTPTYDEITGKLSYIPETALTDGSYTIYIGVKDKAGNEASAISTFRVETDTTPPSITDLSPKDASTIYYSTPTISVKYSDDKSGIDKTTVKILVNAADVTAESTITDEGISYTPDAMITEGGVTVNIEVKDNAGNLATKEFSFDIKILTAEDLLQAVKNNYTLILDYKANMTLNSVYNGDPFGDTQYCKYYFKQSDTEKTVTFTDETMTVKREIIIINNYTLCNVNVETGEYESLNLLEQANVDTAQFSYMDIPYHGDLFKENNTSTCETIDGIAGIGKITAFPKVPNNLYSRLELEIDYRKGLITSTNVYNKDQETQEDMLIDTTEIIDSINIGDVWIPSKTKNIPHVKIGTFYTIFEYTDIEVNTNIPEDEFDPEKQL